jgi:hypothetical protein
MRIVLPLVCLVTLAAGEAAVPPPTPDEVVILEFINQWRTETALVKNRQDELIRQNPGNLVPNGMMGIDKGETHPVPPLVMNLRLMAAARAMAAAGVQPVQEQRTKPDEYLTKAGYQPLDKAIAITAIGAPDLVKAHDMALCQVVERKDVQIKTRTLQQYYLSRIDLLRPELREVGVGLSKGKSGSWGLAEIAGIGQAKRLVGGIAFNDANRNNRYDVGEGVGGITFTCGEAKSVCGPAGAWSLELPHADAATITATGKNVQETFAIEAGETNVYLRWRLPMAADIKECDSLLAATAKETDSAKQRLARLNLLVASRRWIIDRARQEKVAEATQPVQAEFDNIIEAMRDAMPLDPPDFKKKADALKKRFEGIKAGAEWQKTAAAMHALRQQMQAWMMKKDSTPTAPLTQQITKLLAGNPDPEFAKQLQQWALDIEIAGYAVGSTKPAKPK